MAKPYIYAKDPRGYLVKCKKDRFEYINKVKHSESERLITKYLVQSAIEKPEHNLIYASNKDSNCHIYYKKRGQYSAELVVKVEFNKNNIGKITTFHLCSKREPGEIIIWPNMNP